MKGTSKMFIELITLGGDSVFVNPDLVATVQEIKRAEGVERCQVILQNHPALTVVGTVAETLEWLAGKGRPKVIEDLAEADAVAAHVLTVAELRARADVAGIDLGDSTRKADIRDKIIAGSNVADLRELAALEGISLGGARSRDEIVVALNAAPVDAQVEAPTPASSFTSSPDTTSHTSTW